MYPSERMWSDRAAKPCLWFGLSIVCCLVFWLAMPLPAQESGICQRTLQVKDAIVAASGAATCAQVTDTHLREITVLDLRDQAIATLRANDFDGLIRLKSLDLSDNLLTSLPRGVFDELYLLKTLRLNDNLLETLPADIFRELFLLQELTLSGNRLTSLPDGLFGELSRFDGFQANGDPPDNSGPHARLRRFLDRHSITSVEEFISALPALHQERFVMVYRSEALAPQAITEEHPRIIAWGADARFVFSWPTNPETPHPFGESVEFLHQADDRTWMAGVIDFSTPTPKIAQPAVCQSCHGSLSKPLWGGYFRWGGTEGSYTGDELRANKENNYRAAYSTNPRITPLDFSASVFYYAYKRYFQESPPAAPYTGPVEEASLVLALRHAEVLFERLKAREDYAEFAENTVCSSDAGGDAQRSFMEAYDHTIGIFANELRSVSVRGSGLNGVTYPNYNYQDADFGEILVFLIVHDLWENDAAVRRLYRRVSNADLWDGERGARRAGDHMVYPVGRATAEDELIQLYRLHFGYGSRASLAAIAAAQPYYEEGNFTARFGHGHLWTMLPRICATLRGTSLEISSPGPFSVQEGETTVATLSVGEESATAELSWSLLSGTSPDGAHFEMTAEGALVFGAPKDFEAPDDANGDGTYEVTVQVSDGTTAVTADIRVTLANRNEAPVADAGPDQEDIEGGATVTLSGTGDDPDAGDTLSYAWTQTGGTTVTLSAATAATTTFKAPEELSADETLRFTLRVTDGGSLFAEDEVAVTVEASAPPLTARFEGIPDMHNGGQSPFTFQLHFSEEIAISYKTVRDTAFVVTGGTVTGARRVAPPSNLSWHIDVWPAPGADVVLVLSADRSCSARGAICTASDKSLSNGLTATIPIDPDLSVIRGSGGVPLTAWVEGLPERHDGSAAFTFELHFSEEIAISYKTVRDTAFKVTGGTVTGVRRVAPPSNLSWYINVRRASDADVGLVLAANRSCETAGAICTAIGKQLSNGLELTVPGTE